MENNILSGATYFGFSRMHHENRQEAWPWRVMRPLKQPGTQPGELIPDSSYHKDLVMLSLMIVLFFFTKIFSQYSTEFHFHSCSCKTKCLCKTQNLLTNSIQAYQVFLAVEFLSLCFGRTDDGGVTRDGRQGAQMPTPPAPHREQKNPCICS